MKELLNNNMSGREMQDSPYLDSLCQMNLISFRTLAD